MRKDITIARVPWGVRDVLAALGIVIAAPVVIMLLFVVLSRAHIIPSHIVYLIKTNDVLFAALIELITVGTEASVLIWIANRRNATFANFGLRKFRLIPAIALIIMAFVLLTFVVAISFALLVWLLPQFDANQSQKVGFEYGRSGIGLWLSFFSTVIVAPVIEEFYFRGFIMPAVIKRFGWLIGLVSSAALFAVLHLQANVIVYTFVLGLFLGVLYIRTKSIIPGIILHMLNNAIAFAFLASWIH